MKWELFISWRYFSAKRKERFISLISLISIFGIALGVMTLIAVISVMNGFGKEIRDKLVGANPHILVERNEGIDNLEQLLARMDNTEHVAGASPYINGQALFKANEAVTGVFLKGIEARREKNVTQIERYLVSGSLDLTENDIIIGSQLANSFYLALGDQVTIISPIKGRNFDFTVSGIFTSGYYEYDAHLAFTNIEAAQKIFDLPGRVAGIGLRLDDLYQAQAVRESLQQDLGYAYWIRDWMQMNKNIFSALKLEKLMQFIISALIIVVACFSIVGTLIMMVMEKSKDIGILRALGAGRKAIKRIFTFIGLTIGLLGTALGSVAGVLVCRFLNTSELISLPEEIYYIDRVGLPVQMRWTDLAIIVAAALIVSLIASVYPACSAAAMNTADTLRYE